MLTSHASRLTHHVSPQAQTMRAALAHDPHRPAYHYTSPANWLNDPNGLCQWQGLYHLFYQYNPHGAVSATKHWGHAVSTDLVHWTDWPIALTPAPGTADQDGCFSGCLVDHDGIPTIIYTGVRANADGRRRQRPCIAWSHDGLVTWHVHPGNPVIPEPPQGLEIMGFRDHAAWREADGWYMLVGSGLRGQGGTALLYRSPDLITWEYLHPLLVGDGASLPHSHEITGVEALDGSHRRPAKASTQSYFQSLFTGVMWECPDFFPLGGQHVLIVSVFDKERPNVGAPIEVIHHAVYFAGDYVDHKLIPTQQGMVDYGGSWYAPQSFTDETGRRVMFGWLREERALDAQRDAGWSGAMSLPRVLSLRPDGRLGQAVTPEVEALRGRGWRWEGEPLSPSRLFVPDVIGNMLELVAEINPSDAHRVGLTLLASPDGAEATHLVYDRATHTLSLDTTHSSLNPTARRTVWRAPLALAEGEPLRLRVFIDRSIIEVFANDGVCLTSRVYPTGPDALGVSLFAEGGAARLISLDVWEMRGIW